MFCFVLRFSPKFCLPRLFFPGQPAIVGIQASTLICKIYSELLPEVGMYQRQIYSYYSGDGTDDCNFYFGTFCCTSNLWQPISLPDFTSLHLVMPGRYDTPLPPLKSYATFS